MQKWDILPNSNIQSASNLLPWKKERVFDFLGINNNDANTRKFNRVISKTSYLPSILTLKHLCNNYGEKALANIVTHFVEQIHKKRGKWLAIQFFEGPNGVPCIVANDGRGKRYWLFQEPKWDKIIHFKKFFRALQNEQPGKLLFFIHKTSNNFLSKLSNELNKEEHSKINIAIGIFPEPNRVPKHFPLNAYSVDSKSNHLDDLEAEGIYIIREVVAEARNPAMLYSIGKDSGVMLHLARKAFWPLPPPFPLLHIDTKWKFRSMYKFRDRIAGATGIKLIVYANPEGVKTGVNPQIHTPLIHTDIMKTQALRQAIDKFSFDAAIGGARRDEEVSRSKERIFSFRTHNHQWDPKNQRPELWNNFNSKVVEGESLRVFPLSNWRELDIWHYIYREQIPIVPLYYAASRPIIKRNDTFIMVDDSRLNILPKEKIENRSIRFRSLGCYPLTGAILSEANTIEKIIIELYESAQSERKTRIIDYEENSSMERKKIEGYF